MLLSKSLWVLATFGFLVLCGCLKKKEDSATLNSEALLGLTFKGVSFSPHDGQSVSAALVDQETQTVVTTSEVTVADGLFDIEWTELITPGKTYYIDYYADLNANGSCDSPPTDHTWRVALRNYTAEKTLEDSHNLNFFDVCPSFTETTKAEVTGTEVTVTGALQVAAAVQNEDNLTAGESVPLATVFLEGFPRSETQSDADGNFALKLQIPAGSLTESSYEIVMWHTSFQTGDNILTWDEDALRIGARQAIAIDSSSPNTVSAGTVGLSYTSRARVTVKDKATGTGVDGCWLKFPKYGAQLWFQNKTGGVFEIDYLPEGTYEMTLLCTGYQEKSTSITVSAVTEKGQLEDLGDIEIEAE
jgi:hypothetical protein